MRGMLLLAEFLFLYDLSIMIYSFPFTSTYNTLTLPIYLPNPGNIRETKRVELELKAAKRR